MDSAKIQEVARRYLVYPRMSAVVLVPLADKTFDLEPVREAAREMLEPEPAAVAGDRGHRPQKP